MRESSPSLDTRSARGVEFANGLLCSADGSARDGCEIYRVVWFSRKVGDISEGGVNTSFPNQDSSRNSDDESLLQEIVAFSLELAHDKHPEIKYPIERAKIFPFSDGPFIITSH